MTGCCASNRWASRAPSRQLRRRGLERNLRLLSFPALLSPLSALYGHQFFWPLAPVTQIMLHRVIEREGERDGGGGEREREANLAANTRRDFKGGEQHNSRPPPLGPVLPYITFLTLDARWPLLWFFSLNASASCQLSGGSFTDGYR